MSDVFEEQKRRIDNYDSYGAWWENLKAVIKQTCIEFGICKRNVLSRERTSLTKRIIRAKNIFSSGDASASAEIKELESALLSLVTKDRVWKGGADPAFPVLFYENPTSRTFFIAIPNPVFSFPKIHLKRIISVKAKKFKM